MGRRAFIVVLDAVGAGELPDAAAFGDAGSNTLGNVAHAVGGPRPSAPPGARPRQHAAARGLPAARTRRPRSPVRLLEHSLGKDTTVGHWELAGDRDRARLPDLSGRLPAGAARRVRAGDGPWRDRQRRRPRAPRSSSASARSTSARASGSSTRPPTPSSRSPRTRRRCRSRSSTRPAASRAGC